MAELGVRIFKTKWFARFARKEGVEDAALVAAIRQIEAGWADADLGGGIVKQRVARRGQGKSGGYRTIIAYRSGDLAVFLFGFAKSDLDNIGSKDLEDLRRAARGFLNGTAESMARAEREKEVIEVDYDDES